MVFRKSNLFLIFLGLCIVLFCLTVYHALLVQQSDGIALASKREMVQKLGIADLCLFTDARYTRHPTFADLNTAFQDYPLSLEHFPSGSLMPVPPHLRPVASK